MILSKANPNPLAACRSTNGTDNEGKLKGGI